MHPSKPVIYFSTCLITVFFEQVPKSEKLLELEANLAAARKTRNTALCRLLSEAVKKQAEADAALEADDYDTVDRLDAEVSIF